MIKKIGWTVCFVMAITTGWAQAQEISLRTESGAEIGLQMSTYGYNEYVAGNAFMSTKGQKLGLVGTITVALEDALTNWYVSLDGRYADGKVDYEGSGAKSGLTDTLSDYRVLVGRDFEFDDFLLSLYAGAGVRTLYNDLRGTTSAGNVGYRRDSTYVYLPLGITHRVGLGEGDARLATTLEYDHLLEGEQISHTSDFGALNDLKNHQRTGFGARLTLAYETETWSLGGFYNYWNIQSSEKSTYTLLPLITTGYEPLNITREAGIQLKYRFR
jgi:hypothetical protein